MHIVKLKHSEFIINELTKAEDVEQMVRRLNDAPEVAVDTESEEILDEWSPIHRAKMFSIQFGIDHETWFIPTWGKHRELIPIMKPFLENPRRTKIFHNAPFDMHVLANHGIDFQGLLCDTLVAEYTWYNDSWYPETGDRFPAHLRKVDRKLKGLCEMYFDETLPDYKETFQGFTGKRKGSQSRNAKGKLVRRNSYTQNLIDYERTIGGHQIIVDYAAKDPYLTHMLYKHVKKRLEADPWLSKNRKGKSLWDYFQEIEVPFTEALFMMERTGLPLDWEALDKLDSAFGYDERRLRLEWDQACEESGAKQSYNIASPADVASALIDVFGIQLEKQNQNGFSVDKEVLKGISHPIAEIILGWREVSKAKGTYTEMLRESYNKFDGMVYTNLRQTGTRTGRISSDNPNMLNIPSRTESGKALRACFCAKDESEEIWCIDWDSAELKETYNFSKEPVIWNILSQGLKPHAVTAGDIDPEAKAWRNNRTDAAMYKELEKKFPQAYFKGKTFNFGVVYGMGARKYSKMAKISEEEGKLAVKEYWAARKYLKEFRETQAKLAEKFGYVLPLLRVPTWIAEVGSQDPERKSRAARKAGNSMIQTSIAHRAKMVMIYATHNKELRNDGVRLALNIYDEFVYRAPKGAFEKYKERVEDVTRNPMKYIFDVDAPGWEIMGTLGKGRNWREAKENG